MSLLHQYGWNSHLENHLSSRSDKTLTPARVTALQGQQYELITTTGIKDAMLAGALLYNNAPHELPKVGDWVLVTLYEEQAIILEVLPRQHVLSRKQPGKSNDIQVIATHVDVALIVQALDHDFNLMRLQRYLQQVKECMIQPVVLLNKQDLVAHPEDYRQQVTALGYECPVLLISAADKNTLTVLTEQYLTAGKTYALLGSSGVGKSTLMNTLLGQTRQQAGGISEITGKGKHTTTTRNLLLLPNGSLLIDSPGMRELGLTIADGDMITSHHPQINELAAYCRFSDCTHHHEPGCGVIAGVESGEIPMLVYQSYLKLYREQAKFQQSIFEKRTAARRFGKMSREANHLRKKNKY
ncbi:ribosome small subunit-dependent GTPase A [Chitinophaga nivalis]|uniref:Small ribosomal subunit biogenesis GTPase RsgA n=1 Tax=Chitinophaga nivalis TaxID=2991709 RepID=A0ABT3IH15_9BACT|nr:ribosome small subunit-dependent GTPase A [Chitinophaga nivalis]MCW3467049.1 ribosome small subunit-dependent GTPase A [Chitinophaga nivalis]MCW3483260.1 ribosome small subunit-dependent GTPase A [Chitinophaga nivalis]